MDESVWSRVDAYIEGSIVDEPESLKEAVARSAAHDLPAIQVSVPQGKLLYLLALVQGPRRILEIGTLGGYSTIWLARALPTDGRLVTLEYDERHASVARENIAAAGLQERVEIRVGAALDTLSLMAAEGAAPFDMFFIDADKQNNADYFSWAVRLGRPGSLIIVDNVVRGGAVIDGDTNDTAVIGTQRLYVAISEDPRVEATAIQTVGAKGYDGFVLARVLPA